MAGELTCQTFADPPALKFAMLRLTGVVPVSVLLITMIVSAPSLLRMEAKLDRLSGLITVAPTLVSPKVDLFPS